MGKSDGGMEWGRVMEECRVGKSDGGMEWGRVTEECRIGVLVERAMEEGESEGGNGGE